VVGKRRSPKIFLCLAGENEIQHKIIRNLPATRAEIRTLEEYKGLFNITDLG